MDYEEKKKGTLYTICLLLIFILCTIASYYYDPMAIDIPASQWNQPIKEYSNPLVKILMYGIGSQMEIMTSFFYLGEYFAGEYSNVDEVMFYMYGLLLLLGSFSILASQKGTIEIKKLFECQNRRWIIKVLDIFMLNNILGYIMTVIYMAVIRWIVSVSPMGSIHEGMSNLLSLFVYMITFAGVLIAYSMILLFVCYTGILEIATCIPRLLLVNNMINIQLATILFCIVEIPIIVFLWGGFLQERVEKSIGILFRLPFKILYALMIKTPYKIIRGIFGF